MEMLLAMTGGLPALQQARLNAATLGSKNLAAQQKVETQQTAGVLGMVIQAEAGIVGRGITADARKYSSDSRAGYEDRRTTTTDARVRALQEQEAKLRRELATLKAGGGPAKPSYGGPRL
jgi:hypothetical protein